MQPSLFSEAIVSNGNSIKLDSPIPFECVVNGRKIRASVTHLEKNLGSFTYHVTFSDGHADSFVAPQEGSKWNSNRFASPYAKAIAEDLHAICGFHPAKPPFCIRIKSEKEASNVWVVPYRSRENYYSIFYKGEHRFDLRKTGIWETREVRTNAAANQEIAAIVCRNIKQRTLQLALR